jgi:lipopolysaccharide biosynthesis glycosyltransferase
MSKTEPIHVALAADENFAQHLGVAMMSLLHNINPDVALNITVIGDNLSAESVSRLKQIGVEKNVSITFLEADFDIYSGLIVKRHLSRVTYTSFALPDIFDVDKVLYLDSDILVRADISPLWKTDISEYYLGAVLDTYVNGLHGESMIDHRLGLAAGENYFNAGILLLNLKKCRQDNVMKKAINFKLQNHDTTYHDQDGLNAVMHGRWFSLNPCWNIQTSAFRLCYYGKHRRNLPQEIIESVRDPAIVHFTSPEKPWHYECSWPYVEEYFKYLALTPWKDYQPTGWTFRKMIRKNRRLFKRRLKSAILDYRV